MSEARDDEGMPRWVKVFIAIGLVLALLLVAVLVFGDADHGPGRHGTVVDGETGFGADRDAGDAWPLTGVGSDDLAIGRNAG